MKTQRALAKQIKGPQFLIGFEIEGGIPYEKRNACDNIFRSIYGLKWDCDEDCSIYFRNESVECVEYKTKPLPEKEAFTKLFKLFKKLNEIGFKTNSSCGFHVNISERNLFTKPDRIGFLETESIRNYSYDEPTKSVCKFCWHFTNELKPSFWRKMFKRDRNEYCSWNRNYTRYYSDKNNVFKVFSYNLNSWMERGAVSLAKMNYEKKNRRIELRMAGNKDYTKNFELLNQYFESIRSSMYKAYSFAST